MHEQVPWVSVDDVAKHLGVPADVNEHWAEQARRTASSEHQWTTRSPRAARLLGEAFATRRGCRRRDE